MTSKDVRKASCSQCPSTFDLIPPAESEYSIPRESPKTSDYRKRIYECEDERHQNIIYWEKREFVFVSGKSRTESLRSRYGGGRAEGSSLLEPHRGDSLFD